MLSDIWFANIFSHSIGCLFHSVDCFLSHADNFLIWYGSICLFLLLFPLLLVSYLRNHCQDQCQEGFSLFSIRNFIVSGLRFKSLIHLFCMCGIRLELPSFLHMDAQFSQHHLLKKLSFPIVCSWQEGAKNSWLYMCCFMSGLCLIAILFLYISVILF